MKLSRTGVTRLVFVLNDRVIKIPNFTCQWSHFLSGLLANMRESKGWKWNSGVYERGYSRLLCPVIWASWGGWILVMKRVDYIMTWEDEGKYDISEHINQFPGDDKIVNYGLLSGKVVKFDYGS